MYFRTPRMRGGIYYDDKFPGKIIREHPDGGKEFVGLDEDGKTVVVGFPG